MLLYRRCSILCRSCFCRPFSSVTSFDTDGDTKRRRGRNASSSSDDDEPRTVETTDRTNENVSSPRPEDTKDTRDDVCLDNDDAWSVRRSAMNMNGWRRCCFLSRLVLLLVCLCHIRPKTSVCSRPFFCALKMSSSSSKKGMGKRRTGFILWSSLSSKLKIVVNTQKSSSQNFSSFTKGDNNIYNQSSSLVCAPFLHRLYLFIGCERERERAGQRSPRDRARARGSNRYRSPFYYR